MRRALIAAGVAAAATLLAAGCGSSGSSSSARPQAAPSAPVTLRLGFLVNITHASALVGIKEGFFTKDLGHGVTLKLTPFSTGTEESTALLAGPARRGLRGPESGDQGLADVGRQAHQGHLRRRVRRRRAGGQVQHHQRPHSSRARTLASPSLGNTQDVVAALLAQEHRA